MRIFKSKRQASYTDERLKRLYDAVNDLPEPLDDVPDVPIKKYKKGCATGDFHGDKFCLKTFERLIAKAQEGYNDMLLIAGDFTDCTAFSPHNTGRDEGRTWSRESDNVGILLEVLCEEFKEVLILPGTHDFWINKALRTGSLSFEQVARLYIPPTLYENGQVRVGNMTWTTLDRQGKAPVVFYHSGTYLKTPLAGAERAFWRCLDYYDKRCHVVAFHGHETHVAIRGPEGQKRYWIEAGGMASRSKNLYPHYYLDDRYRMWTPAFVTWDGSSGDIHLDVIHELSK